MIWFTLLIMKRIGSFVLALLLSANSPVMAGGFGEDPYAAVNNNYGGGPTAPAYAVGLSDVDQNHWAYDSVKEVVEDYGIMRGDGTGRFFGYKQPTRYELATTISNLIKFYNEEFTADREDLTSLANIMEQFQQELRLLESQNADLRSQISRLESGLEAKVAHNEEHIDTLRESGFIYDKVIKGTARDLKHIAYGFSHENEWAKRKAERQASRGNDELAVLDESDVAGELLEEVDDSYLDSEYILEQ